MTDSGKPTALADEAELDAFLAEHDRVLLEAYTDGCGICASMEPVLGNVARATDVAVALVNPRDDPPLVERLNVTSVPLLVYYENGEPVRRVADGFQGADAVLEFVDEPVEA
ncbi:thioredoxin family protein [Halorubellus sp. PRR65]|uniref:thioredoxin family protein n=1 Tax=Halorubellus sp. PRR65 TaxID=3098148 RepID=UPI002B2610DD|nr:thioredoxin family protein [Halorubellus sp. PRR65]